MKTRIDGGPSFCHIHADLEPGETLVTESDAMASMDSDLDVKAVFNGGFIKGLLRKFLGGESLFVNRFTNNTSEARRLTVSQTTPGEIRELEMSGESICLQPGAYICSTTGLRLGLKWAGFRSWIAREGLFKLVVSGTGTLWYGAYGSLFDKEIDGEYIVDTSHLVAYDPQIKLKIQLAGGIFSSFFGGEGLVTRVEGRGKVIMQSRSLDGLKSWVNPRIY